MEGFLCYRFGGLIYGGAYFRNFMVCPPSQIPPLPPSSGLERKKKITVSPNVSLMCMCKNKK